jgi:nesprin-1
LFEADCESKLNQLQNILAKSQTISCNTNASDEVDAIHSRWTALHDQVTQRHAKLQKLVTTWHEYNALSQDMCNWMSHKEREIKAMKDQSGDNLESDQSKLKVKFIISYTMMNFLSF